MNLRNFTELMKKNSGKTRFSQEEADEKANDTESETSVSKPVPKNITFNLMVGLEDIYKKIEKTIAIKMNVKCKECNGTGLICITKVKKKKNTKNKKKAKRLTWIKKVCDKCRGCMIEKERKIYDQIVLKIKLYSGMNTIQMMKQVMGI